MSTPSIPSGRWGRWNVSAEAFGHRQDRDHRQVEDLGDLLELARQVALGTGLDLQGTIQRPFDDGELGVASPAEEERAADVGGHQPGIEVPTRQAGDLTGHLHGRGTGAGPEVLGPHVLFRETRQQGQGHHRRFRPRGRGRQSQPRNIHHHRSRTRRADPISRSLPRPGPGRPGTAPGIARGALDAIGGRLDPHADPDDRTVDRVDFMQSRGKEDPARRDRLGGRAAGWKDQPSRYSLTSQMIAPKSGRSRLNRGARLLKKAWCFARGLADVAMLSRTWFAALARRFSGIDRLARSPHFALRPDDPRANLPHRIGTIVEPTRDPDRGRDPAMRSSFFGRARTAGRGSTDRPTGHSSASRYTGTFRPWSRPGLTLRAGAIVFILAGTARGPRAGG